MEDGLVIEEDIGGSEWKLISLFAVLDGHGGAECMEHVRDNLVEKVRAWTPLLDEAGDLNEMIKILMNKSFFELDYEFFQKHPDLAQTCGATGLVLLVIESKAFVFSLGDCKGYTFRNEVLFQLNLDHLPVRMRPRRAGATSACASRTPADSSSTTASWASARYPAASASSSTR